MRYIPQRFQQIEDSTSSHLSSTHASQHARAPTGFIALTTFVVPTRSPQPTWMSPVACARFAPRHDDFHDLRNGINHDCKSPKFVRVNSCVGFGNVGAIFLVPDLPLVRLRTSAVRVSQEIPYSAELPHDDQHHRNAIRNSTPSTSIHIGFESSEIAVKQMHIAP